MYNFYYKDNKYIIDNNTNIYFEVLKIILKNDYKELNDNIINKYASLFIIHKINFVKNLIKIKEDNIIIDDNYYIEFLKLLNEIKLYSLLY